MPQEGWPQAVIQKFTWVWITAPPLRRWVALGLRDVTFLSPRSLIGEVSSQEA